MFVDPLTVNRTVTPWSGRSAAVRTVTVTVCVVPTGFVAAGGERATTGGAGVRSDTGKTSFAPPVPALEMPTALVTSTASTNASPWSRVVPAGLVIVAS